MADRELGLACVQAYNDWMIDDWCAARAGPADPDDHPPAVGCGAGDRRGGALRSARARAVTFSENPAALGLPSVHDRRGYWDPVFAACAEAGHAGVHAHRLVVAACRTRATTRHRSSSPRCPSNLAASALADWFYSGLFVRYPSLKLCLSEGGIGWIPAIVERADYVFERYAPAAEDRHRVRADGHGLGRRRRVQPRVGRTPDRASCSATTCSAASSTTATAPARSRRSASAT